MIKIFVIFAVLYYGVAYADNYITQNVNGGCDAANLLTVNNKTVLTPVFEPIEYTCNSGTFLPANSTQCVACPTGFTCPGGTYAFNENQASGISAPNNINQNAAKVCSSNLLKTVNHKTVLKAVFEPKTVTLNFDNGNGTNTSTTCTYDGLINLPETPTRPGYAFKGWKLITND